MSRTIIASLLLLPLLATSAPLPEALLNGLLGHGHRPTSSGAGLGVDAIVNDYKGTGMGRPSGYDGIFKRNILGRDLLGGLGAGILDGADPLSGAGAGVLGGSDPLGGAGAGILDGADPLGGAGILGGADPLGSANPLGGAGILGGSDPLGSGLGPLDPITNILGPVTGPLSPALKPLAILGIDVDLLTPTDLLCAKVEGEFVNKAYALGCVCLGQDGLLLTAEAGVTVVDGLVDWITAQVNVGGFHSMYPEYGVPTCDKNPEDDGGEFRCPLGKERKANGKCAPILLASPPVRTTTAGSTASPSPAVTPANADPTPTPSPSPSVVVASDPAAPPAAPAPTPAPSPAPSAGNGNGNNGNGNNGNGNGNGGNGNGNGNNGNANANSAPVDNGDGEDDLPYCDELDGYSATGADDSGEGDGEWVQVTSMTSTETVTIPATAYVQMQTQTVTVTSTSTSTVTETKTETSNNCQQTFAAASVPQNTTPNSGENNNNNPAPAPVPAGPSPIDAAAASTPTPSTAAPAPTSTEDDDAFKPNGNRLNSKPRPNSPCPPGQVMGATMCCRADQIERNGECACKDGFQNLIDLCVEICLPPLTLVGGKCLKLDLGVASDLTKDLGLGSTSDLLGGVLGGKGDSLGGLLGGSGDLLGGTGGSPLGLGGLGLL